MSLIINNITVKMNSGRFYSLTELHKASGGEVKFLPSKFTRKFVGYCDEITSKSGRYGGGTFASVRVAEEYVNWINGTINPSFRVRMNKESAALDTIEQLLSIKLERQFKVKNYRIDGYHAGSNTAYEIDEGQHKITSIYEKDKIRESIIKNEIGCDFVRIKV